MILVCNTDFSSFGSDTFIIFSGGMPRASCGDRHTVSVMQGNQHVVFDFTSRVVDFVTMNSAEELSEIEKGSMLWPRLASVICFPLIRPKDCSITEAVVLFVVS